jgi:hypothetical protein
MTLPGVTLSDAKGGKRIRMLQDRVRHIDEQVAELQDKKSIMQHEILELLGAGCLSDMGDEGKTAAKILHEIRQLKGRC